LSVNEVQHQQAPHDAGVGDSFFRSIGTKASIPMALVVLLVAFAAFRWQTEHERTTLMAAKNVAGNMVVRMLSSAAVAPLEFDDPEGIEEELEYIQGDSEVVSAAVWKIVDGELSTEPVAKYLADGGPAVEAPPIHDGAQTHHAERQVGFSRLVESDDGTKLGMARVELSLERELAAFERTEALFKRIALGFVAAVTLVLGLVLRVVVVSPLSNLVDAARRIERGETGRADVGGRDEVGRLSLGFNNMAVAIEEREERIAASNRQLTRLFDNMGQSIFSFGPDLEVHGQVSKVGLELFGGELDEGARVADVLLSGVGEDSPEWEALTLWLEAVFPQGAAGWEGLVSLAPSETVLRPGSDDERQLLLEFRPIIDEGELRAVMVLATDETEKRALARKAREMQSRHDREMASMRKILASGTQLFVDFLRSTDQRLVRIKQVLGHPEEPLRKGAIDELFRHAHTIKGEARTFELLVLRDAAERLEEALAATRTEFGTERVRKSYDETRARFVEASPIGETVLDQTTVSRSDLSRLLEGAREQGGLGRSGLLPLVERLASRPFGEVMVALVDATPTWAESVGKRAPRRRDPPRPQLD
jgi:HPt (histidine-containing phosphotransfer) domain-containing protein/HAMP domain-containing protein